MNLCDYISERLEVATKDIKNLEKEDEKQLTLFVEKLLDPNFILDALKGISPNVSTDSMGPFAKSIVNDIVTYVKTLPLLHKDKDISGLLDTESQQRLRIAVDSLLYNIKNKPKKDDNKEALNEYLLRAKEFAKKLGESWNKNEFIKNGDINMQVKMLYLLNITDIYITKLLKDEQGEIIVNMKGVKANNIRLFVKFLIDIIKDNDNSFEFKDKVDSLITDFSNFENVQNALGGDSSGSSGDHGSSGSSGDHGSSGSSGDHGSSGSSSSGSQGDSRDDEPKNVPGFATVEIPLNSSGHDFKIMASNGYVPYAISQDSIVITTDAECYNPEFIFTDRRFHDALALELLNDPELTVYEGNTKECATKLVSFFSKEYPEYKKIIFKEEKRDYEKKDGDKEITFNSFFSLLRIYNLREKYGILPLDPEVINREYDYSREISHWLVWIKDQVGPYKEKSIRAYPFVQEFAAGGGKVPDGFPFDKNPWRVWDIMNKYWRLGLSGPPTSLHSELAPKGSSELAPKGSSTTGLAPKGSSGPHATEGFFSDGSFGETKLGSYRANNGYFMNTPAVQNNRWYNQYESLCYLKPENTIKYVVSIILGFILARTYKDYRLYYDIQKSKNFDMNRFRQRDIYTALRKKPVQGNTKTLLEETVDNVYGGSDEKKYNINRKYSSLYRDIIILGTWYFKKIDDPNLLEIVTRMSGRWSTINQIFLDMKSRGGLYQIQDINTIIFRINHVIREIPKADILNDFIETFHIVLKSIVNSKIPQILPLNLDISTTLDNYTKNLEAYRPVIELESSLIERYNINGAIMEKIRKIKSRYISDLSISSGSEMDIKVLMDSLNYQQFITKDTPTSKVMEMLKSTADRGLITPYYANIFNEIYKRSKGVILGDARSISRNAQTRYKSTDDALAAISKHFPLINSGIDDTDVENFFYLSLGKRLLLDFSINVGVSQDQIEASLDDDYTIISKYVSENYKEGTVVGAVHPMNNLIDIYNSVSKNFNIKEDIYKQIKEYLIVKYDPRRMSPIPNHVYDVFETLLANFIFMGPKNVVGNDPLISYMDSDDNDINSHSRNNGSKGERILYNEISLINSTTDILRTTKYFNIPPLYTSNVYYNFFTNYVRKNLTPIMQSTKFSEKNYINIIFDIFKKGYLES